MSKPSVHDYTSVWVKASDGINPKGEALAGALRKRFRELGLSLDPAAQWTIELRELKIPLFENQVEGQSAANSSDAMVEVISSYQEKNASRSRRLYSFMRAWPTLPATGAAELSQMVLLHHPTPYQAANVNGRWILRPSTVEAFKAVPGRVLIDQDLRAHEVELVDAQSNMMGLARGATQACSADKDGAICHLAAGGLVKQAPVQGWKRLPLRILGAIPADARVYVSGYEAQQTEGGQWDFWGVSGQGANLTVVAGPEIIYRGRVVSERDRPAILSLPSARLSKR